MKTLIRIAAVAALTLAGAAMAQTEAHPYLKNDAEAVKSACASNPAECSQAKARAHEGVENAKTACKDNPTGCQEVANKAHATAESAKAKCEADPAACQDIKSNAIGRQSNRMNRRAGSTQ